jgi:hypothetical protein
VNDSLINKQISLVSLFLSKIRLSTHSLAIETGRYNKPFTPAEERYCKYCLNQVENEKHFLLYCKAVFGRRQTVTFKCFSFGE